MFEKLSFKKKTLSSFAQMRDDMDQFRISMNDWIVFLDGELKKSNEEISDLRKRMSELEMKRRFNL